MDVTLGKGFTSCIHRAKKARKDVHRPYALPNTCFALLVLSRATRPLAPPAS